MRWPSAKRSLIVYLTLVGCGLAVCAWQREEHLRFKRAAAQALINRGRDITSTLGVVVRSQRRFGAVISKDRLQSALQDLIRPEELESIAVLGATGETIASAGKAVELTPEMLSARGVSWQERTVTLMNLMDLGSSGGEEGSRTRTTIVVTSSREFRAPSSRRPNEPRPTTEPAAPGAATNVGPSAAPNAAPGATPGPTQAAPSETAVTSSSVNVAASRVTFGRPMWMTAEEYDAVIQKQGVHSLVISLSTAEMQRLVQNDLVLRSLVSLLALGGALLSGLAWRNLAKNSELQIRLVKAGEMNAHLKEMNLAAAGLAHETRNPLNLIRGLAQMIAMQPEGSPKLKEHASTIVDEADRVTVQLNEFINYSKPREAHFAPVELKQVIANLARALLPDIEDKQIQLQVPDTPLTVEADEQLLRQALFNVLLNAIQSVGAGGRIEIAWSRVSPQEAVLEISDDGPGVPEAERLSIFKPYVTMRPGGVGLGLAIVWQIVSAHRWEIACLPRAPHGVTFRFTHLKIVGASL